MNPTEALLARHESEIAMCPVVQIAELRVLQRKELASHARSLQSDLDAARQEIAEWVERHQAVLDGQRRLAEQTVRIRRAILGISPESDDIAPGVDTEELARIARQEIAELRERVIEECAQRIEPKNPPRDWTEYARVMAEGAAAIRALKGG